MLKNRSHLIFVTLTMAFAFAVAFSACTKKEHAPENNAAATAQTGNTAGTTQQAAAGQPTEPVTELKVNDLKPGDGVVAENGKKVLVHYTGWLTDGKKFDSSLDRGTPLSFQLGAGQVIKGWEQGVAGMKVGGKRKLTIPPQLAYGEQGAGSVIPPNSTLVFEVELLKVE